MFLSPFPLLSQVGQAAWLEQAAKVLGARRFFRLERGLPHAGHSDRGRQAYGGDTAAARRTCARFLSKDWGVRPLSGGEGAGKIRPTSECMWEEEPRLSSSAVSILQFIFVRDGGTSCVTSIIVGYGAYRLRIWTQVVYLTRQGDFFQKGWTGLSRLTFYGKVAHISSRFPCDMRVSGEGT